MTTKRRISEDEMIRTTWFNNHVAEYTVLKDAAGHEVERLVWKKPGTSSYGVYYIRMGSVLFVAGDIGEAVYQWGENVSLEWISRLDSEYFRGKCQASDSGRGYLVWDQRLAEQRFKEICKEENVSKEKIEDIEFGIGFDLSHREEWHQFLHTHGHDFLGHSDYYEYGDIGDRGSIRCLGHLIGLKMAFNTKVVKT